MNKPTDNKKILLIDPDDVCRRILSQRLSISGYHILSTADSMQAIDIINKTPPDAIISELSMPKLNGKQLCSKLKKNKQTAHIPIIILTNKNAAQDTIDTLDAGASDYITKPFAIPELEARLRTALISTSRYA